MNKTVTTDIVIIGGGIAGLWLLNRLRQLNLSTILLESNTLGGGQTHLSQGIIHGGMKYALQGKLTPAAAAIASMPDVWAKCLRGVGEIDLSQVPILSFQQYLWTSGGIGSSLTGFFAKLALKGNVTKLTKSEFPAIFQQPKFKGDVYALDETVIDVHALVRELVKHNQDIIFKIDPLTIENLNLDQDGNLEPFAVNASPLAPITVKAKKYIFLAGKGNESLISKLNLPPIAMQKRPLHMVIVKHDFGMPVYAHCLGLSAAPRLTITTHEAVDGKIIWYLGGQLAEDGVNRSEAEQIATTKKELKELFPWLDFTNAQFATFKVDRAEALQPAGKRPDSCSMKNIANMIIGWPTKLAFAPLLAQEIIDHLNLAECKAHKIDTHELRGWPIPGLAKPIWDDLLC
jgi:glycerol-3-phosphate dehydrogenase